MPNTHPLYDHEGYHAFPRSRWVYNKIAIAESQGIPHGPHGILPTPEDYPVISKPVMNLTGLGTGTLLCATEEDYIERARPGSMWMRRVEGPHRSTDVVLAGGRQVWSCAVEGYPGEGFTFKGWAVGVLPGPEEEVLGQWLEGWLPAHTGCVNVETIGTTIIEVHLRPSSQFLGFYPDGFADALMTLLEGGRWEDPGTARQGWSLPIWSQKDVKVTAEMVLASSGAVEWRVDPGEEGSDYLNPDGWFLYGFVNGTDLAQLNELRAEILRGFG